MRCAPRPPRARSPFEPGNRNASGSPSGREALERRAARISEPEHARALVERLAGGVVERAPEHLEAVVLADVREQRVPAARNQAQERRLERTVAGVIAAEQEVRRDVALEVIDRRERQLAGGGERLRRGQADEQRADQARALRRRDQLDLLEADAGVAQRARDDHVDQLEVVARGDLRHDAAEARVRLLGGDHVRADRPIPVDHRRARVVAARLQREDRHTGPGFGTSSSEPCSVAGVRHITSASSPLSW